MNDSNLLGIIGGSGLLKSNFFKSASKQLVETEHGNVVFYFSDKYVFCQRHQSDPEVEYSPPHLIPKKRIIAGFAKLGIKRIISFASVGSLKREIVFGSVVIIDDFFNLWEQISFFDDARAHFVPNMECNLRNQVISLLIEANIQPLLTKGTYVQTTGPRFETKAEIRFLGTCCDVVGMTAAHEAVLCMEMKIEYAIVGIVDNYANGVSNNLTVEEFYLAQHANQNKLESIASLLINKLTS